jgi:rubrerythrin
MTCEWPMGQVGRGVEEGHATLYKRALRYMAAETAPVYYVCQVCGSTAEREVPERCSVCNAPQEQFRQIT